MNVQSPGRVWLRELAGIAVALLMVTIVIAHLVSSERRVLLFSDGDSVLLPLIVNSVAVGQPQDWAMSSVLFLPELAVFGGLSILGLGMTVTLALNAFVNYLALYGAIRLVAGGRMHTQAPVVGALLAVGMFCVLSLLESSPSGNALELTSLLATTSYYSATLIAVVLTIGLMRRLADDGSWRLGSRTVLIAVLAAVSTLSNPLFLAWAVVPLGVVLAVLVMTRPNSRPTVIAAAVALVSGAIIGLVCRIPLAHLITNTGVGYAQPSRWADSIAYYSGLLSDRAQSLAGLVAIGLSIAAWVAAIFIWSIARRRRADGAAFVAASAWVTPVIVVLGAITLGTHAARYLEPIAFAPVLALAVVPQLTGAPTMARAASVVRTVMIAGAVLLLSVTSAVAAPRVVEGVSVVDPDVSCVTQWVANSGQTGAGQFWTVRNLKAHLDDPRHLIQVDTNLRGYAWLVNRDDFTIDEVSFFVLDDQSLPFNLPTGLSIDDGKKTQCGRYTIVDFAPATISIGTPVS